VGVNITGKEEVLLHLLTEIGMKKNVARVLVFLEKNPCATFRATRQGTDLGRYEVRTVLQYLGGQGWIQSSRRNENIRRTGRPVDVYRLAKPFPVIIDSIVKEKTREADKRIQLIRKLRDYPL